MIRGLRAFAFVCLLMLLAPAVPAAADEGRVHRLGFVVTTLSNPFFVDMTEAAREEARKHPGLALSVYAPQRATDTDEQLQIVEGLLAQKVDAICLVPADSRSAVVAVVKANAASIPVIVVDSKLHTELARKMGAKVAAFIGSDNAAGGKLAGEFMMQQLRGPQTVELAILEGMSGAEPAVDRRDGFLAALRADPAFKVVASRPADWDREKGLNVAQDILQSHPALRGIFASNDEMALGAVQAVRLAGREREVMVVGFDAIREAVAAVEQGKLAATIAQRPAEMGRRSVAMAADLLQGRAIPPETATEVVVVAKHTRASSPP